MSTVLVAVPAFLLGAFAWFAGEYLLHRFAMHELHGKGIMSREHLEHHVTSSWGFSSTHLLSWLGVMVVGSLLWLPLGWWIAGPAAGIAAAVGWCAAYAWYEAHHALAHLRPPATAYGRWLRRHHFHHHFGHPMSNHGVSVPWWDHVFGTHERPGQVRVPRRLALPWLVDDDGELRPEYRDDYVLVGAASSDERTAAIDRARAFASQAPPD